LLASLACLARFIMHRRARLLRKELETNRA
jgi:hypothetical protein